MMSQKFVARSIGNTETNQRPVVHKHGALPFSEKLAILQNDEMEL